MKLTGIGIAILIVGVLTGCGVIYTITYWPGLYDNFTDAKHAGVRVIVHDGNDLIRQDARGVQSALGKKTAEDTCFNDDGTKDLACLRKQRRPLAVHVAAMQDEVEANNAIAKREITNHGDALYFRANRDEWTDDFENKRAAPQLVKVQVVGSYVDGKEPVVCGSGTTTETRIEARECYGPEGMSADLDTFDGGIYKGDKTLLQVGDDKQVIPGAPPGNLGAVVARLHRDNGTISRPIQVGRLYASCGSGWVQHGNNRRRKVGTQVHWEDWGKVSGQYKVTTTLNDPLAITACNANPGADFVPLGPQAAPPTQLPPGTLLAKN